MSSTPGDQVKASNQSNKPFQAFSVVIPGKHEILHLALTLDSAHMPRGSELTFGVRELSGCTALVEQGLGHFQSGWGSLGFSLQGWGKERKDSSQQRRALRWAVSSETPLRLCSTIPSPLWGCPHLQNL